jgi:hypothetical protein
MDQLIIAIKCIIALAASAYGSFHILCIGLMGPGETPLLKSSLLVFAVTSAAGMVIALLPEAPYRPVLTAASIPAGFLAFLMAAVFLEKRNVMALCWLGFPIGLVILTVLPVTIRMRVGRKPNSSEPAL